MLAEPLAAQGFVFGSQGGQLASTVSDHRSLRKNVRQETFYRISQHAFRNVYSGQRAILPPQV